jgi:hypothetical protein
MSIQNDTNDNKGTNDEAASFSGSTKDENEKQTSKSFKDKILNRVSPNSSGYSEPERISNNVTRIILGLFMLVGFIVLVTAIFVAAIGNGDGQQAQILGNVFIAAIVGGFTIVGTIIYQVRGR